MSKLRVGLKKYTPTQNLYIMVFGELPETDVAPEEVPKLAEFVYRNGSRWCANSQILMEYLGIRGEKPCPQQSALEKSLHKSAIKGLRRPKVSQMLKSFYSSRDDLRATIKELQCQVSDLKLEKAMLLARVNLAIQDGKVLKLREPKEWEISKNPYDLSAEELGLPKSTVNWLSQYKSCLVKPKNDARMLSGIPKMD
ncbi:MAG: hypothetical protein LBC86_06075, partial [Oscillospiraceae bacterium]|nr:hypothetical protein [Oscillospiraceae bacterium]